MNAQTQQSEEPVYTDEDWLVQKHHDEKMSLNAIAREIGVSDPTILYWMQKHEIPVIETQVGRPPTRQELADEEWMRREYVDNRKSTSEIGNMLDVSSTCVGYWLNKHGIKTRVNEKSDVNPDFRLTGRWMRLRCEIYKRDDYQCQHCGAEHCEIHAHHVTPVSEGGAKWDEDNLLTLCVGCHMEVHHG